MIDMAICMAFFSPVNSKNLLNNYNFIKNKLDKAEIPNYTIELVYEDKQPVINNPFIRLYTKSIMFHKENLLNILANKIKNKYDKLCFLDTDIIFTDPDWYNRSSEMLNKYDIIQPYEYGIWQDKNVNLELSSPCASQFMKINNELNFSECHPGFSWAMTTDIFNKINGLFEYQVLGAGDALFAMALNHTDLKSNHYGYHKSIVNFYKDYLNNIKKYKININYLNNCDAIHLYHGSIKNRNYGKQNKPDKIELVKNTHNVLEWKNIDNNKIILSNFINRKEDD
jgi:hypothetical protein